MIKAGDWARAEETRGLITGNITRVVDEGTVYADEDGILRVGTAAINLSTDADGCFMPWVVVLAHRPASNG